MRVSSLMAERLAGQRPPLSCRTSPPQGGRSAVIAGFANLRRGRIERGAKAANLPPSGGDVRQDRGGRRRALTSTVRSRLSRFWNDDVIRDIDNVCQHIVIVAGLAAAPPMEELVP